MNNYGSGMIQPGKWVNKSTGNTIFVKQSLMDGDTMLVLTDQGQITMDEFRNYIQVEDGEIIPTLQDLYGDNKPNGQLLAQINQGLDPEDRITINNKKPSIKKQQDINNILERGLGEQEKPIVKKNPNYDLIKRVFDKFPVERTINFDIIEDEWPFKEFNMLVNILDVPIKDICDYVIDNYLDKEHLSKSLEEYFKSHIIEC